MKIKMETKIAEFYQPMIWPKKFYVGMCGDVGAFPDVLDFLADPTKYKKAPQVRGGDFLVLTEDRKLFTFRNPASWLSLNQDYYAVGSGAPYAMAAMESGKDPLQAVKIAAKYDIYTGMGYKSHSLEKKEKKLKE